MACVGAISFYCAQSLTLDICSKQVPENLLKPHLAGRILLLRRNVWLLDHLVCSDELSGTRKIRLRHADANFYKCFA